MVAFTLTSRHTVQEVYKVASKNNAYTQFWSQYSSVRSTHSLPAKDVDGWLVTGASQDHFVVFHHLKTFTFTENFATILAGSTSPPSDVHRLTVCSALKNGHLLCRIEHFHFLDGILTSLCIFYSILYTVLSLSWTVCPMIMRMEMITMMMMATRWWWW